MDSILEFKSLHGEVKDVDTNRRIVTGYLSSFGNIDKVDDTIEKGAFAKTLMERKDDIYFLNQHRWAQPHGKFAQLNEDQKGLYFESNKMPPTSYSNDVLKLYEAGIMKEHSIGFQTIKSRQLKSGVRLIQEVRLFEGSNVTVGADPNTPFLGTKSTMKELNDQSKLIYKALRDGTFTDETFNLLEIALKQLQTQAYNLGKESLSKPVEETTSDEPINVLKAFNLKNI